MPVIGQQQSIPAGATVSLSAGNLLEYMPNDAYVEFGIFARATGVVMLIASGTEILCQEMAVPVNATADAFPKYPDDFHWRDEAAAGDRTLWQVRNTTAGAVVVAFVAHVEWI